MPIPVWEGTALAFRKKDGTPVVEAVDLKGEKGDRGDAGQRPEHRWDGTRLSIQNADGSWPDSGVELRGEKGDAGDTGPCPGHRWDGTRLSIQNADGSWPDSGVELKGEKGDAGDSSALLDENGKILVKHMPLTDALNSATGTLAASDTAVKTLNDRLNGLSSSPADSRLWIGVPRFWRSTTLPPNHCWANGDFVAFADWPELKAVYESGGFAGLLMAWDADGEKQAANLGQWRLDAAIPTGLYTPNLTGQFLRCWGPGIERQAGSWQEDAFQGHGHTLHAGQGAGSSGGTGYMGHNLTDFTGVVTGPQSLDGYGTARIADETRPANIALPCIIYLGQPAAN